MATFYRQIKKLNTKKAVFVILVAGFVAVLLSSPFAGAAGPQFNIFPISYTPGTLNHDLPLLDAKNVTQGIPYSGSQSDHDNGVPANPGDIIEFSIYYHNGAANTDQNVAVGTVIGASVSPSFGSTTQTHTMSASVAASNASMVTSSSRGGDMRVAVASSQPLSLSYIPGTTVLYKDRGQASPPSPQTMPDSIFSGGVNIGDVRGCFEFHGFVNFRVRVSELAATGTLAVKKYVRNVTTNSSFEDSQVSVQPGQTVEYKIVATASGGAVESANVRDSALDSRLSLAGSVTLDGSSVSSSSFFSSSGVSLGSMPSGSTKTILFQATVAGSGSFTSGITTNFLDTATAWSGSQTVQDDAIVSVNVAAQQIVCTFTYDAPHVADGSGRGLRRVGDPANVREQVSGLQPNSSFNIKNVHTSGSPVFRSAQSADASGNYFLAKDTTIIPSGYISGDYNSYIEVGGVNVANCLGFRIEQAQVLQLQITKDVRNENTGAGFADSVNAQPGNRMTFRLTLSPGSSNANLQNVVVRDSLPGKMTYVSGTLNVNGNTGFDSNSFFGSGVSVGQIAPGQQVQITFQADVASTANFTAGQCESLTNTGFATASGGLSQSDTATVSVCKDQITKQPGSPGSRPLTN